MTQTELLGDTHCMIILNLLATNLLHGIDELKRKPFFITGQSLDLMVLCIHWTLRVHRVNYELLNK